MKLPALSLPPFGLRLRLASVIVILMIGMAAVMVVAWQSVEQTVAAKLLVMLAATLLATILAMTAAGLFTLRSSRAIRNALQKLSTGDTAMVRQMNPHTEFGTIEAAIFALRDKMLERRRIEEENIAAAKLLEERRRLERLETERRQTEANELIASLNRALETISLGNLTYRIEDEFPAELEKLRNSFNAAAENLRLTISVVKRGATGIRNGTDEISDASDDLARRTETQAASIEETAGAIAELSKSMIKTATDASRARVVAATAKEEADKSGAVVRRTVDAMDGIQESSQKINQIIGVIDEIAFQTNLLALNAGVEAARAGEAGRGFAVVAQEVRALAQRSADAAKEIKGILATSRQQVENGVGLVAETGAALEKIVARVTEINDLVAQIAITAQQQSTGLQEVNTAVDQLDKSTQQNAAMAEESTAASKMLAEQTEELSQTVDKFVTTDRPDVQTRKGEQLGRGVPQETKSHRPEVGTRNLPVQKLAKVVGSSLESGWKEF